jgi:hypothetical protein
MILTAAAKKSGEDEEDDDEDEDFNPKQDEEDAEEQDDDIAPPPGRDFKLKANPHISNFAEYPPSPKQHSATPTSATLLSILLLLSSIQQARRSNPIVLLKILQRHLLEIVRFAKIVVITS